MIKRIYRCSSSQALLQAKASQLGTRIHQLHRSLEPGQAAFVAFFDEFNRLLRDPGLPPNAADIARAWDTVGRVCERYPARWILEPENLWHVLHAQGKCAGSRKAGIDVCHWV